MTVHWTELALGHLSSLRDYIAQNSLQYAQRMLDRITRRSMNLATAPFMGWMVQEYDDESIREVLEYPYRIIYKVLTDRIDILAIVHSARRLPRNLAD